MPAGTVRNLRVRFAKHADLTEVDRAEERFPARGRDILSGNEDYVFKLPVRSTCAPCCTAAIMPVAGMSPTSRSCTLQGDVQLVH